MNRGWLIWQLSWRSILRGLVYGALCGALFGLSFTMLFIFDEFRSFPRIREIVGMFFGITTFGGFLGGIIGTGVGVVLAFLISVITINSFLPLSDSAYYLKTVQRWSTIIGGIASLMILWLFYAVLFGFRADDFVSFSIFCLLPTVLATAALWRNSYEVARWYVRTTEAHATLEQGIANQ